MRTAIPKALADLERPYANSFVKHVRSADPRIKDVDAISDPDLACLYNFASYYFFCASHGDADISGRPPSEMYAELQGALRRLERGETKMSEWIRGYTEPV